MTVFIDNASLSTLKTDESGSYTVTIPVERLSTGPHSLHAQSGTTFSDNRTLTISAVGSTTTLSVTRPNTTGEVTCTGSVIANLPVRSAPVQLVWDTTHVVGTSTDAQGQFKTILQLPDGKHTLVARFSGEEFPISASESKPQVVDVSLLRIIPFETIAGVLLSLTGILLLFIGIAWYYLRRIPGRRTFDLLRGREPASQRTPETEISGPEGEPGAEESGASSLDTSLIPDEPVISRYARILKKEGMGGASWAVYRQFARHIAHDLFIPRHTTLTPRELSRFCVQKPFCAAFASFVSTYERIRYGGQRSVAAQTEFETRMHAIQSELDEGLP